MRMGVRPPETRERPDVIEIQAKDIDQAMKSLKKAMAAGADGKIIKRELSKRLRAIMQPLANEQKARILRLPSKGHPGPSMRQAWRM